MLDIASNGPLGVVKNDGICDIAVNIITFLLCYLLHITNLKEKVIIDFEIVCKEGCFCLLYTSPSPRDATLSRMPSSA